MAAGRDSTNDLYSMGKVMFVALIGVVSSELGLLARFWTWEFCLTALVSYCLVRHRRPAPPPPAPLDRRRGCVAQCVRGWA